MPRSLVVSIALLLLAVPAFSQDLESIAGLRFRFDAPGGRAAAMGGASAALADSFDVVSNPAALARQKERVLAIETRRVSNEFDYATAGPSPMVTTASHETTSHHVSSAIFATPRWALYYDEPIDASVNTASIPYDDEPISIPPIAVVTPWLGRFRAGYRVRRYGAAAGSAFGALAVGASVQYTRLDESVAGHGSSQRASDGRWTWNAGAQYSLTPRLRLGASYRGAQEFDAARRVLDFEGFPTDPATLATPSSLAAGIAAEVTPNLTIAADIVRVGYSEMLRADFDVFVPGSNATTVYGFPDVTELRAGAEYRLQTRVPIALRAGWWREPSHRIRVVQSFNSPEFDQFTNDYFLMDQDENHVTAGIGVGTRVRVDAAFDRSEHTSRASIALATTF